MRDSRGHSPQRLPSSESQALRFPRLRFQEAEPTSHEGQGRETAGAEGGEATRRPAAAAHTPAHAFQSQAGARSSLLGTELPWLLLAFCRAKGSEDGGRGRTVVPSAPAGLSPQPGSAVWALGPPHHPSREQDPFWTPSRRQCRKAGRQAVGGALQREPRPDCATCTDVSGPWKPIFFASAKLGSDVHSAFLTKLLFCVLST